MASSSSEFVGHVKGVNFGSFEPELADEQETVEQKSREDEMLLLAELQALGGMERASFREAGEFWQLACLRARKYNLERAIDLVDNFVEFRREYEIDTRPLATCERVQAQLQAGFFRSFGVRDRKGRFILNVDMTRNDRERFSTEDSVRCIYAVLEYVLRHFPESQTCGVVIVNNMTNVNMSHFHFPVFKILLKSLTSRLPLRFGGSYLVHPPFFLRMVLPVVKLLMKKKLAERLRVIRSEEELHAHVEPSHVIRDLGGTHPTDMTVFVHGVLATCTPIPVALPL